MSFASACVLSYERPLYLQTCLASMLDAPGARLQLIVHDDGSTDQDARGVIAQHREATAILNPAGHNQGRGVAMNRCFAIAEGDPLIVVDQDLVFHAGWLRTVNELLAANPRIGLLSGFRYWHAPCDWRQTLVAEHDGWQEHSIIMGSFMAIRRACWEELGPFDSYSTAFAEDNAFQRKVTASERWVCGTPAEDLMRNDGYGLGPSTVAIRGPGGLPTTAPIHLTPWVLG